MLHIYWKAKEAGTQQSQATGLGGWSGACPLHDASHRAALDSDCFGGPGGRIEEALGDHAVGDVTARAAADENLRADIPCAVDAEDASPWRLTRAKHRRREPGRTGPDDEDVSRIAVQQRHA